MRLSRAAVAVAIAVVTTPHGSAGAVTYVGAGQWPTGDVAATCTAEKLVDLDMPCEFKGTSKVVRPGPQPGTTVEWEACVNAVTIVSSPVVVGTNPGCRVEFEARLVTSGAVQRLPLPTQEQTYDLTAGACAGLSLVDPTVNLIDGLAGSYTVHVRVAQKGLTLTFEGEHLEVDALDVQVIHTAGALALTCQRLKTGSVTVAGTFHGSYELV